MAFSRKEHVVVSLLLLPVGIAVNGLLLWGFRNEFNPRDPLFWIIQIAWLAVLYRSFRRGNRSRGLAR